MTFTITTKTNSFWAYLQLMRPANIVTAWADILAGVGASGFFLVLGEKIQQGEILTNLIPLGYLLIATTGLYSGGIVLNDAFDADVDAQERPERPIPSGRASRQGAFILGSTLLSIGVLAASQVSHLSAILAASIATAAVLYDAFGKHHAVFGPLNMGVCRGVNLLLGVSIVPPIVGQYWFLALIPITYIAAITTLSQGEVHGGKKGNAIAASILISMVFASFFGLSLLKNYNLFTALPFAVFLAVRVLLPMIAAIREPNPEKIRTAVRAGVLSVIVLNATLTSGFAGLLCGLLVLSLLPISLTLAKTFAVT
jgi:4-hydroxybenzoate polyprenyltransferase